jgi:hypothetical protein
VFQQGVYVAVDKARELLLGKEQLLWEMTVLTERSVIELDGIQDKIVNLHWGCTLFLR